jgi:predicted Rossmann fold nucleotide-binding protein DprA/Smf involved in DNA uptake
MKTNMPEATHSLFPDQPSTRFELPADCITVTGSRDVDAARLAAAMPKALSAFLGMQRRWLLGGAVGVDDLVSQWLLSQGESVTGVVPFLQADQPKAAQGTLSRLTGGCLELGYSKTKKAYLDRNAFMVDHSNVVIAFWNGEKGGTWQTIQYALKIGRETHVYPVPGTNH